MPDRSSREIVLGRVADILTNDADARAKAVAAANRLLKAYSVKLVEINKGDGMVERITEAIMRRWDEGIVSGAKVHKMVLAEIPGIRTVEWNAGLDEAERLMKLRMAQKRRR